MVTLKAHSSAGIKPPTQCASSQLRIIVLGYIVRGPIGGMAWHHLQYVLGLKQLGHEVLFLEESDDYPSCYDPSTHSIGTDPMYGLGFAERAFDKLGLQDCWAYFDAHHTGWNGPASGAAPRFCNDAEVVLNVSGVNRIRGWYEKVPVRVLIDTDPIFTQIRHLNDADAYSRAVRHNAFFSFGELMGAAKSAIPNDGFDWHPTRQPIVLDAWPFSEGPTDRPFTTVMQWESYPAVEWNGRRFGMKSDSFNVLNDLPGRVQSPLEIALGGASAPRRELQRAGWQIVDPLVVARDISTYQEYLRMSRGELSIAKHGYVATQSGWFSERTACYLATGRPAVVQDTGFSRRLPCGAGLWAFDDATAAIDALEHINSNYDAECRSARELAAAYFDSRKVLASLLEQAFAVAGRSNPTVVMR
jgi:hypothetical protein